MLAEFGKSFGFNLTDTLARNGKLLAYFFKGVALAVFKAKAHFNNFVHALKVSKARPAPALLGAGWLLILQVLHRLRLQ